MTGTNERTIVVTADCLPRGTVDELDHHLVIERFSSQFMRKSLIDTQTPSSRVNRLPDSLSYLVRLRQALGIVPDTLECFTCCHVQAEIVFPVTARPAKRRSFFHPEFQPMPFADVGVESSCSPGE